MKRKTGLDLLRLVLMLMVVILHILGQGGVLEATKQDAVKHGAAWFLETAAYCAVNCYAMISGYVYVGKKTRLSSLGMIWLQTLVYSLGIAACAWLLKPELFSVKILCYFAFPVTKGAYWYVSAYAGMFLLIPVLNAGIESLSKLQFTRLLGMVFVMYAILPTFLKADPYGTQVGYSTMWLCLMYLTGAAIKKYEWGSNLSKLRLAVVYLLSVAVAWSTILLPGEKMKSMPLVRYTSPFIVVAAIALLLFFAKIEVDGKAGKAIVKVAPAAFGVYLIHVHDYVFGHYMGDAFVFLAKKSTCVMILGVLCAAAAIFVVCLAVDYVRHVVFEKLQIKRCLMKLEEKLIKESCGR